MLSDPSVLVIDGNNVNCARISSGQTSDGLTTIYQNSDRTVTFSVSQKTTNKDRVRVTVRLDVKAVVTNPLNSTDQDYDTNTVYVVMDRPLFGFSEADVEKHVEALKAFLTSTNIGKLYGGES
jgi:hypothetical protein